LYSNNYGFTNLYWGREQNLDRWYIKRNVESAWEPVFQTDPLAFEDPFRPVGYGTDLERLFNIAWDTESLAFGLYRLDLNGDLENQRVFVHGAVDVELVDTMGKYNRVVSAAFLDGRTQRAIVDPRVAEVFEYLSGLLPELEIEIFDESWDQTKYLARVRAPSSAGEFILVDMENESVRPIGAEYAQFEGYELAETRLIQIGSSTGGTIAAHLTLPHEVDWDSPVEPVPAVIIPRALPTHEDVADPHYLVQFLAASGYAVLRVNNRVEEEYGRGWLEERAVIGWNQSADDINDAASYLIDNGYSEPEQICGAGKDYGAYTALMSAIKYPELFSCVVSIAGVTDPRETPGAGIVTATASGEDNLLDQASPVRRADELDAPVLLFHGRGDADFDMAEHAVTLTRALERADKDVVFIEYPQANHAISRGPDRIDMLARIGGFLAEHIGPPVVND
jgi:dipeptidyl aminopeptidase/acylaminoacyl peptidase